MIEYLKQEPFALPAVVSAPPPVLVAGDAVVTPGFERGALLLRGADEKLVRLSWEERQPGSDRRRALPAGEYALVGYRLIQTDAQGTTWQVSAGGKTIRTLALGAGSEQRVEIEPAIHMERRVQREELGVSIQGENGAGLTIYKDRKRISLAFRRLDAQGRALGEGKIQYG